MVAVTKSPDRQALRQFERKSADSQLAGFLDTTKRSSTACQFERTLREKVVGQDQAVQALVDLYQMFCAGLQSLSRPIGNLLFLGPAGSGKTRIVEAAAEILFGDSRAVIKVDCAEFQHSHEISKLIGSPPGYPTLIRLEKLKLETRRRRSQIYLGKLQFVVLTLAYGSRSHFAGDAAYRN